MLPVLEERRKEISKSSLWQAFRLACRVVSAGAAQALKDSFVHWHKVMEQSIRNEVDATLHYLVRALGDALSLWRRTTVHRAAMEAALRPLRTAFSCWYAVLHNERVRALLQSRVDTNMQRHALVRHSLRRWKTRAISMRVPRILQNFVLCWTQRVGFAALDQWRAVSSAGGPKRRLLMMQRAADRWSRQWLAMAYNTWAQWSTVGRDTESINAKMYCAVIQLAHHRAVRFLNTWRNSSQGDAMCRGLLTWLHRELSRAFNTWVAAHAEVKAQRECLHRAVMKMRAGHLARAMTTWKEPP